ncbi:MAG: hypothetical protein AAFV53_15185 [Myxococcota bacterium]
MDISWELNNIDIMGRINELKRTDEGVVIGITAAPEDRVDALEVGGEAYDEMQVIYQTRSKSEVRRLRTEFSELFDGYRDSYQSSRSGPPFYLYTLR